MDAKPADISASLEEEYSRWDHFGRLVVKPEVRRKVTRAEGLHFRVAVIQPGTANAERP